MFPSGVFLAGNARQTGGFPCPTSPSCLRAPSPRGSRLPPSPLFPVRAVLRPLPARGCIPGLGRFHYDVMCCGCRHVSCIWGSFSFSYLGVYSFHRIGKMFSGILLPTCLSFGASDCVRMRPPECDPAPRRFFSGPPASPSPWVVSGSVTIDSPPPAPLWVLCGSYVPATLWS